MTIPSPRQFASMTNIGSLSRLGVVYFLWAIFLFMSGGAHAQVFTPKEGMLSRDIMVEQYQKGEVVATWPWVNYGLYYESLLQMAYDPVLPPSRWSVIPGLLDRLVITERAQNGQLLRRFQVTDQDYVYTYQSYAYKYKRDLGKFSNMLRDIFKLLPEDYSTRENSADGPPPFTIMIQDTKSTVTRRVLDGTPFLKSFQEMVRVHLKESRPLDPLEEINMNNNFKGPDTIQLLIRGDQIDLPDEITIKGGQIRIRESMVVTRGYVDRLGWRAQALDQRKQYEDWKSRGLMTPPRLR